MKVQLLLVAFAAVSAVADEQGIEDAMKMPSLGDVRLEGPLAEKMETFLDRRIVDRTCRENIFEECRRAFAFRDDDEVYWNGQWRGEFWGKSMMSAARTAVYRNDAELKRWISDECRRLVALEDAAGDLCSYSSVTNVSNPPEQRAAHGGCTNWNLWNRKYAIWGLYLAYEATGDRFALAAAARQLGRLVDTVRAHGIRLEDTGHPTLNGMPTMSILKPALMIYAATKDAKFLDFARAIVAGWDRADGRAPNFFRNAGRDVPLHAWYPQPGSWAKTYEMLSCLDGLVEHYRVTGDARSLETVKRIAANLQRTESNQIGGLGISDRLTGAESLPFASTEVCDVVHWIRLNLDLFLVTGEKSYLDAVEFSYFNAFLAGIVRNAGWTPLVVRDAGRHYFTAGQCGYGYNQCCVDNAARTFMDVASAVVTRDRRGVFHVNLYQDATVTLDGVRFEIRGDYPAHGRVTVRVTGKADVRFRKPGWCPKLDVQTSRTSQASQTFQLAFDMNPRLENRVLTPSPVSASERDATAEFSRLRYVFNREKDLLPFLPTEPYATVCYGPLVLARAARLGARKHELQDLSTVNGKGYSVTLRPIVAEGVYAPFDVELAKPGQPTIRTKACAYESASDDLASSGGYAFSIRF